MTLESLQRDIFDPSVSSVKRKRDCAYSSLVKSSPASSSFACHVNKKHFASSFPSSCLISRRKVLAIFLVFAILLKDHTSRAYADSHLSPVVVPALAATAVAAALSSEDDSGLRATNSAGNSAEGPDGGSSAAPLLLNLVNPCGKS